MKFFNYNGKTFPEGTLVIGPSNRGLRYGDGLFETIRYRKDKLEFSDLHFARLWKGMELLQFQFPAHFSPEGLEEQIIVLLKKNRHEACARVRLTVFRGDGGLYDPVNHQPHYLLETWALNDDGDQLNTNGLIMGIYDEVRKPLGPLSKLKHNNHLPYVLAALYAKKQQWNDAALLNPADRICDTTLANLFCIKDEVIITPPLSEGCIAGVVREHLLRQLPELGFSVKESALEIKDLLDADELFVTNSIHPLRWVQRFEEKKYSNSFTQKIFAALLPTI